MSSRVQEKYLSLSQIFIERGVPSLSNNLFENAVKNVVGNVPLSENVSLSDVEMYVNTMVSMCPNVCNQGLNNQLLCILVFSHNNRSANKTKTNWQGHTEWVAPGGK